MNRTARAQLAKETLEVLEAGEYARPDGVRVSFRAELEECLQGTRFYQPEELSGILASVLSTPGSSRTARIEVVNETTLAGINRLVLDGADGVAALNFASAKNPGGGFLGGSQAQEESLARSSGLYPSLLKTWPYYEQHRAMSSSLYSDAMILSPRCPVIREDSGMFLKSVQRVSFISSAAPNAGAIRNNQPTDLHLVPSVLRRRAEYVLALAASQGYSSLVLGAWGCGVFRNDPAMVAGTFASLLGEGQWARRFSRIVFSVLDTSESQEVYRAFEAQLGPLGASSA